MFRDGLVRDRRPVAVTGARDRIGCRGFLLPLPLSLPLPRSLSLVLPNARGGASRR